MCLCIYAYSSILPMKILKPITSALFISAIKIKINVGIEFLKKNF